MTASMKTRLIYGGLAFLLYTHGVMAVPIDPQPLNSLSVPMVMKKLESYGYYDFRMIKVERKHSEIVVKARNKSGELVKLVMDLHSGKVLDEVFDHSEY